MVGGVEALGMMMPMDGNGAVEGVSTVPRDQPTHLSVMSDSRYSTEAVAQ